jgi:hypothetical protein
MSLSIVPLVRALETPPAPKVEVVGTPGTGKAAYWIIAGNAEGEWTAPSPPTVVENLPDKMDEVNCAVITVEPVDGAVDYAVLKTEAMLPVKEVKVTAKNPGEKDYYYWVEWWDNWRRSELAGPAHVRCGDPAGNVIEWTGVPNATYYHVYRTSTPEPPVGRGLYAVGLQVAGHPKFKWYAPQGPTRIEDKGWLGQTAVGFPPTPVTVPPLGSGLYLVGKTKGDPVKDIGKPLDRFDVSNINQTKQVAITGPAEKCSDVVARLGGQYVVTADNKPKHLRVPSFGGGHAETLVVVNNFESGGHSEYHMPPNGIPGWKSWINTITARTESHTASQHGTLTTHLDVYGSGDAIPFGNTLNFYGTNNDAGDEGAYSERNSVHRGLNSWRGKLAEAAPRGSMKLAMEKIDFNGGGTERILVNLSQAHRKGRIARVGNVDVHGKGTEWTGEMVGRFISFDVDNVGDYRMWYWITEVKSPTELTILAKTGWSYACNIGYSRFIWDPETMKGSQPAMTNSAALRKLPKDKEQAASEGGYVICPGVLLGAPWKSGKTFNTEPLREDWHAGDEIELAPGPQGYIAFARFALHGELLPQDQVGGITIVNRTNRITNFPAIQINGPGNHGFREGVRVTLPKDGDGDGIVISSADRWGPDGLPAGKTGVYRASIVVPDNLPAIVGEHNWRYPHIRWRFSGDGKSDALEIGMGGSKPAASFDRGGRTTIHRLIAEEHVNMEKTCRIGGDLTIDGRVVGNERTRGKAVFSGDGEKAQFKVSFAKSFKSEPFITISTNQFLSARLAEVKRDHVMVEFQQPPEQGEKNVVIYWSAQE